MPKNTIEAPYSETCVEGYHLNGYKDIVRVIEMRDEHHRKNGGFRPLRMSTTNKRISSATIGLIIILSLIHPFSYPVFAGSEWQYFEGLDFYFSGDSGYWVMNLTGGNITIPGLNFSFHPLNQVEELNLTLFHVSTLHPRFNFFRDGVLYETLLPEFLPQSASLTMYLEDSLTKDEALEAAWEISKLISDEFYLAFAEARSLGGNGFEFVSPIEPEAHIPKIYDVLPTSLEGFSSLVSTDMLLEEDVSYITISTSREGDDYLNSILVGVVEPSILLEDKFSMDNVLPGSIAKRTSPYSNSSTVTFHLRHAYVKSVPQNSTTSYESDRDLTLVKNRLEANASIPDLELSYTYSSPLLVVNRELNATVLLEGQTLEAKLTVSNIGETEAENVTLTEEAWWSPEEFEMIDGVLSDTLSSLAKDQTRSIEYRLRLKYSGPPNSMKIPQVNVTFQSKGIGRNTTYTVYSNSQILWLGRVLAPSLSVTMKNILPSNPTIMDEIRYDTEVFNNGSAVAERVQIGGVDIGSIEPGESYSREWRTKTENDGDLLKALSTSVTWLFNETTYSVESPLFHMRFNPTTSLRPTVRVSRNISQSSSTEENLTLMVNTEITNVGDELIDDLTFQSRLPDGATFIEGNVSYDPELHEVRNSTINLEEDGHILFNYSILVPPGSVTIFPEASVEGISKSLASTFKSGIESFADSVELVRIMPIRETVIGVNASLTLQIQNRGSFPIYELTIDQPTPRVGTLTNASETHITKLEPANSFEADFTYAPTKAEVIEIDEAIARGIVGGRYNSAYVNATNIKVYRGLSVGLEAPPSVTEDESFRVNIDISSDLPGEIENIEVTYHLPMELMVTGKSSGVNGSTPVLPSNGSTTLWMDLVSPDPIRTPLNLPFPKVLYSYRGFRLNYTSVFSGEGEEKRIVIKENLVERYGIVVLVVVAASLATVFYLKRSITPSSEKKKMVR